VKTDGASIETFTVDAASSKKKPLDQWKKLHTYYIIVYIYIYYYYYHYYYYIIQYIYIYISIHIWFSPESEQVWSIRGLHDESTCGIPRRTWVDVEMCHDLWPMSKTWGHIASILILP
jgi:hypothetical protein